jgi:hypothetical protein
VYHSAIHQTFLIFSNCILVPTFDLPSTLERLLKNLKIELPCDPAIRLLRIYPKECESGYNKGTCKTMFIAALLIIAKVYKQSKFPTTDVSLLPYPLFPALIITLNH